MNRRELFGAAAFALSTAGLVFSTRPIQAGSDGIEAVIQNVVRDRVWSQNPEAYSRLRLGAFIQLKLETQFGTANELPTDDSTFSLLYDLLPGNPAEWFNGRLYASEVFVEDHEEELAETFSVLYDRHFFSYLAWMDSLGILGSGQFADTMLSGQAFATVVHLAREDDGGTILSTLDALQTCFFPFCTRLYSSRFSG
jgi:hypothetical protein